MPDGQAVLHTKVPGSASVHVSLPAIAACVYAAAKASRMSLEVEREREGSGRRWLWSGSAIDSNHEAMLCVTEAGSGQSMWDTC